MCRPQTNDDGGIPNNDNQRCNRSDNCCCGVKMFQTNIFLTRHHEEKRCVTFGGAQDQERKEEREKREEAPRLGEEAFGNLHTETGSSKWSSLRKKNGCIATWLSIFDAWLPRNEYPSISIFVAITSLNFLNNEGV